MVFFPLFQNTCSARKTKVKLEMLTRRVICHLNKNQRTWDINTNLLVKAPSSAQLVHRLPPLRSSLCLVPEKWECRCLNVPFLHVSFSLLPKKGGFFSRLSFLSIPSIRNLYVLNLLYLLTFNCDKCIFLSCTFPSLQVVFIIKQ